MRLSVELGAPAPESDASRPQGFRLRRLLDGRTECLSSEEGVVEMRKRIFCTFVVVLAVAGPAAAGTTPLGGVVVGTGNGAVLVATPGGKLTAVAGRAAVGTRVVLRHGKLVVV